VMLIHFIRHAESASNLTGTVTSKMPGTGLSALGREQADKLAVHLNLSEQDVVVSSPLRRAVETAERLVAKRGCQRIVLEELREFEVGELEGHTDQQARERLWAAWPTWLDSGQLDHRPAEGSESGREALARFRTSLAVVGQLGLERAYVVSHGTLLQLCLTHDCVNVPTADTEDRWIPNTAVVTAVYDGTVLMCRQWDTMTFGASV